MSPAPGQEEQQQDEWEQLDLEDLIKRQGGAPALSDEEIGALLTPPKAS